MPAAVRRIVEGRPSLPPWLHFDLDAFWYLSRMRPINFGSIGFIPENAIESYARMRGIPMPSENMEDLVTNIRVLDDEYMNIQREEDESRRKADEDKDKKQKTGAR